MTSGEMPGSSDDREDRIAEAAGGGAGAGAGHTVTVRNETGERVWVGATVNADGSAPLTGLPVLDDGQSETIRIPERAGAGHWRGKLFPRQGCLGKEGSTFHCDVGDCGPYAHRCTLGEQPASLAEFNFDTEDELAPWYNVSYVNAVSAPITITPDGADPPENGGECAPVGCPADLLSRCPPENLTKDKKSGRPLVCVNPNRDARTAYSNALSKECPSAYAWSKHDTEPGNQVVRQCAECDGLTVTFHGKDKDRDRGQGQGPGQGSGHGKGVAVERGEGGAEALADSGVSWYHNWASSSPGIKEPKGVEYVPTIWGPDSVTDAELNAAKREGRNLLAFNEPDLDSQADMTPEQALDLWPRLESTGLRLGAPAVATDADKPGSWLDRFMKGAEKRGLRVDFIPVHWYGADFGPAAADQLSGYLERVHKRYKKPVWLTEYALTDFPEKKGETRRYPGEKEQSAFVRSSLDSLRKRDYVERYAWFALSTRTSPTGLYDGAEPNASGKIFRNAE
ncbi:glycosyl hydrolase [Streptomyces sp. NPDC048172]|uniref:glycosyl hydrolase n=1 Tax=Streptomyces sp. NPDC048172 TaxID=3365505 RepID=UPI0037235D41